MYLYCSDCDVKLTIMWIKFENKIKIKAICTSESEQYQSKPLTT